MSVLRIEKQGGIATITLDRPEKLNALNAELRAAIARTFTELAGDPATRVAILTGAGRAFSAGIDLAELSGETEMTRSGASEFDLIEAMHAYPNPIIGAVNGHAITGGFELALACDVLVASTQAVFGDTHARVGIVPGWGLSQKLPRLIGIHRAKEISLTGNFVGAEQAERWGLVNRVVAPEELLPTCRAIAADMLSCDPASLRRYKEMIDRGFATTFAEGMALEARMSREHLRQVTPDAVAGRRSSVQARGREQQGGAR
jgi:enoyl-CoA hydratase/carnithine racemase